jgi:hypothetical protein
VAFTAAIIHLIDAKPENRPCQQQAIQGLGTCMSALQEMTATWGAWSYKALQAIRAIAQKWGLGEVMNTCSELGT